MGDAILQADNAAIINKVRANASLEYQSRIPVVTQANLSKTFATLQAYQPMWNEFMDVLINRIGLTLFNQNSFTNRLKPLKSGAMNYGGMIQEIGANLLHAEAYDPNDTNVYGGEKADVEVNYHQINRRDKYKMRVNNDLLEESFLNDGQLAAFVNNLLSLPQKSDEWDEYIIMRGLLRKYQVADGFFNYQVPNLHVPRPRGRRKEDHRAALRGVPRHQGLLPHQVQRARHAGSARGANPSRNAQVLRQARRERARGGVPYGQGRLPGRPNHRGR